MTRTTSTTLRADIMSDPCVPYALRDILDRLDKTDPVDALYIAETVATWARMRASEALQSPTYERLSPNPTPTHTGG